MITNDGKKSQNTFCKTCEKTPLIEETSEKEQLSRNTKETFRRRSQI